jgi:hypothetical protein
MDDCKADFIYLLLGDVFIAVNFYFKKKKTEPIGYGKQRNILDLFKFCKLISVLK